MNRLLTAAHYLSCQTFSLLFCLEKINELIPSGPKDAFSLSLSLSPPSLSPSLPPSLPLFVNKLLFQASVVGLVCLLLCRPLQISLIVQSLTRPLLWPALASHVVPGDPPQLKNYVLYRSALYRSLSSDTTTTHTGMHYLVFLVVGDLSRGRITLS